MKKTTLIIILLISLSSSAANALMPTKKEDPLRFFKKASTQQQNKSVIIQQNLEKLNQYADGQHTEDVLPLLEETLALMQTYKLELINSGLDTDSTEIKNINTTIGDLYYTKGLIYTEEKNDLEIAEISYIKAANYEPSYILKFLDFANNEATKRNYLKTELYLTCFIETYDTSKAELAKAYKLRGKIRAKYLDNQVGAKKDFEKAKELENII